ncbi:MAG: OsmC family protein [Nitrososphaerota archaeon]
MSSRKFSVNVSFFPERGTIIAEVEGKKPLSMVLSEDYLSPVELALASLGACAASTTHRHLSIRGALVRRISVGVEIEKIPLGEGKGMDEVSLNFLVEADRVGTEEVENLIAQILEKYCNVAILFRENIKLNQHVKVTSRTKP